MTQRFHLQRSFFGPREETVLTAEGFQASLFRYDSGIEAVRLQNSRGYVTVLPYMGQMIWDAVMDGVDLTMTNMFPQPRPVATVVETYGCFAFHSGLLRNGCPSPQDTHPLHGEMPCATMDSAELVWGHDEQGPYLRLTGSCEYAMGFGSHYLARPALTLRQNKTVFDISMDIENLSGDDMELMYMCHMNFAYAEDGTIHQPTGFTPEDTVVRTSIPGHVVPNDDFKALIASLAEDPSVMATLHETARYNPEQVLFIKNLHTDADGKTHLMLRRTEKDGFYTSYSTKDFPHTVRWVLCNSDQQVAAFALPATCEPEGYLAEKAKGNVQIIPGHGKRHFNVTAGYLDAAEAEKAANLIAKL
ncbi:MAG: aldose 1-epimerase family protein [Desulfovibrio sp.]|uniref:aldose 1-epimerase family protein n=1 Tax=Desulfovibrio sp. 7SRBS1 TaxID=3378064 RepID=UPI003B3ED638